MIKIIRDETRTQIIEDFRWWQAKFPGELIPWQVMFIQRPDTISPELIEAARRAWFSREQAPSVVAASAAHEATRADEGKKA